MLSIPSILPNPIKSGSLPYFLYFIGAVSVFNTVQTYLSPDLKMTKKVYLKAPEGQVTNLSARTFGTWTILTAVVRLYGAFYLQNAQIYELCQFTFLVAFGHFFSEWLIYGTCKMDKGLLGPAIVSTVGTTWMYLQKDYYTS